MEMRNSSTIKYLKWIRKNWLGLYLSLAVSVTLTSIMTLTSIYTEVTLYEYYLEVLERYPFMLITWALLFWFFQAIGMEKEAYQKRT